MIADVRRPQAQLPGGAPLHPAGIPAGIPTDAATGAPPTVPLGQDAGKQSMIPGGAPIQPSPPIGTMTPPPMRLAAPQAPVQAMASPQPELDQRQFGTHRRRGGGVPLGRRQRVKKILARYGVGI